MFKCLEKHITLFVEKYSDIKIKINKLLSLLNNKFKKFMV